MLCNIVPSQSDITSPSQFVDAVIPMTYISSLCASKDFIIRAIYGFLGCKPIYKEHEKRKDVCHRLAF